jgi:tetratricopeptide (TPR) repeat protein
MERAVALLPEEAPLRSELLPALAQSLFDLGQLEQTRRVVEGAKATARTVGDRRLETRIALVEALLLAQTDPDFDMDIAVVAENALPVLEEAGDDQGLAEAYALLAKHLSWSGRNTASDDAFAKAIDHARRAKDRQIEMNARSWLALNCAYGSIEVAEGLARVDRLLEESQGGVDFEGSAWAARGVLLAMQGRFDEARADIEKGRNIYLELGVTLHWAGTAALESIVHVLAGDLPSAETVLRAGVDELEKLGETGYAATLYGMLAGVLQEQGRGDDAFGVTELCRTVAAESDIDPQANWRRVRARILARRGETAEAEELAREALGIIEGTEMLDWHVDTLLALAEVLQASGGEAERQERLSEALALLERRGNVVKASTVVALLN